MTYVTTLADEDLLTAVTEALTRPSDFGYSGDLPLFESWGITFTQSRDSDALGRSNYRRILEDLRTFVAEQHPDDNADEWVTDIHCSHWAFGSVDHIVVRILVDQDGDRIVDNISPVFTRAAEIAFNLRNEYPAYDEMDYSELESEENKESYDSEWDIMVGRWDDDEGPKPTDEEREALHRWYRDEDETPGGEGYYHDDIAERLKEFRAETVAHPPIDPQGSLFE